MASPKWNKDSQITLHSGSSREEFDPPPMTKCTAMITLKVDNGEFSSQDVKTALKNRLETIENQLGVCEQMIKIKAGTQEEMISRKKADKLHKEKERVSVNCKATILKKHLHLGLHSLHIPATLWGTSLNELGKVLTFSSHSMKERRNSSSKKIVPFKNINFFEIGPKLTSLLNIFQVNYFFWGGILLECE